MSYALEVLVAIAEDREANVRKLAVEEEDEKRIRELANVLLVEDGLLEDVGLVSKLALVEVVTGARNRNAELDVEALGELAFRIKHLKVLVGNVLEEVLELKLEIRFCIGL